MAAAIISVERQTETTLMFYDILNVKIPCSTSTILFRRVSDEKIFCNTSPISLQNVHMMYSLADPSASLPPVRPSATFGIREQRDLPSPKLVSTN